MYLTQICSLVDSYYIANSHGELNKTYLASSDMIFTDGEYLHSITHDGYIKIYGITINANYIVFLDKNNSVYLGVLKFINEKKYQDIQQAISTLREAFKLKQKESTEEVTHIDLVKHESSPSEIAALPPSTESSDLYDMNNFTCPECGNSDIDNISISNEYKLIKRCNACKVQFTMVPSRWYVIESRTVFAPKTINSLDFGDV